MNGTFFALRAMVCDRDIDEQSRLTLSQTLKAHADELEREASNREKEMLELRRHAGIARGAARAAEEAEKILI